MYASATQGGDNESAGGLGLLVLLINTAWRKIV